MAGFLAFVSSTRAPVPAGFARAVSVFESDKGLVAREVAAGARHFRRRNGSGGAPAVSERGWLLSAGDWQHPACEGNAELLALLEAEGEEALEGLDGFFAIAWLRDGALTVLPDHFGRLHVYAAEGDGGVYVATSPVALAAAVRASPDPLGAWEFLATGNVYEERTLFDGVRRLGGAARYRFPGGAREEIATFLVPARDGGARDRTPDDLFEAYRKALPETVENALPDLTGGLDSRLVVGLLQARGARFDVTVTGAADDADVVVAERLAARLGWKILREAPAGAPDFDAVLRAAARVDGEYDAIEYAAIQSIHEPHSERYARSINGSGGEVLRNYWWDASHFSGGVDAVRELLRRFTHSASAVPFRPDAPDVAAHFRGVLERTLAPRAGEGYVALSDHAYLALRMQCWQGAIASATNEIWRTDSPLLLRRPLEVLYRIPDKRRLGTRLFRDLLARFPAAFSTERLADGFPPLAPGLWNAWRFLPGLAAMPAAFARRVAARLRRGRPDPAGAERVRALMASGAAEYLVPRSMAAAPLADRGALDSFLSRAAADGMVSMALLGRLISLEFALRRAQE